VQLFRSGIKPRGEARPDWSAIQEIARAIGARWGYTSSAEIMNEIAETVPGYAGMTYDRLGVTARRRSSVLTVGAESVEPVQIALVEPQVASAAAPAAGKQVVPPMPQAAPRPPTLVEKVVSAVTSAVQPPPEGPKDYALAISRSLYDAGILVLQTDIVQPRVPQPVAEVNSHDAEDLALENGMRVRLTLDTKPARTLELPAHVNGHVPPGVVLVGNNLEGTYNLPMGARVKVEKV
jgi:formate dehydrogenase major subunit